MTISLPMPFIFRKRLWASALMRSRGCGRDRRRYMAKASAPARGEPAAWQMRRTRSLSSRGAPRGPVPFATRLSRREPRAPIRRALDRSATT